MIQTKKERKPNILHLFWTQQPSLIVQREPLEALVAEVKKTLEATKVVSNYKG